LLLIIKYNIIMAQERTIQDYYEEIYDKYSNIPKSDIKRIL